VLYLSDESFDLEVKMNKSGVEKEDATEEMIKSERKEILRYRWCTITFLIQRFICLSHDGRPI
jgi:hypothetical protein